MSLSNEKVIPLFMHAPVLLVCRKKDGQITDANKGEEQIK